VAARCNRAQNILHTNVTFLSPRGFQITPKIYMFVFYRNATYPFHEFNENSYKPINHQRRPGGRWCYTGSLYLSLKPKFETKNRFQTEVKPKHKVTLSFGFKPSINQSRCRTRVTSVGDFINESLICRPVLCFPD